MSFTDRLVLWLHIGFAIFAIGPVALAISSTPRYIRRREVPILRYLSRITVIFTIGSLFVLVFGIVLAQLRHEFSQPWLTVAMTLFVVAIVLLILVIRDQRRAIGALASDLAGAADRAGAGAAAHSGLPGSPADAGAATTATVTGTATATADATAAAEAEARAAHVASVERGRIAALGGVVNLIWLVILALMVWRP
jgi:cbb3-type cytochrome oxidase subunit 3